MKDHGATAIPREGCVDVLIHIDEDRTRGIRGEAAVDLTTCRHPEHLRSAMRRRVDALEAFLRDPEWPLRLDDEGARATVLLELGQLERVLERLAAVVAEPPELHRIRAEITRAIRLERARA